MQFDVITNVVAVAGGGYHSAALLSDGTVMTWGLNSQGQIGDGTLQHTVSPYLVMRVG